MSHLNFQLLSLSNKVFLIAWKVQNIQLIHIYINKIKHKNDAHINYIRRHDIISEIHITNHMSSIKIGKKNISSIWEIELHFELSLNTKCVKVDISKDRRAHWCFFDTLADVNKKDAQTAGQEQVLPCYMRGRHLHLLG